MILGPRSRSVTDRGGDILKYGLAALNRYEISLPHAESIFSVLGRMLSGNLTGLWVARSEGLNGDGCFWSQMLKFGSPVIRQLTRLSIAERLGRFVQRELTG